MTRTTASILSNPLIAVHSIRASQGPFSHFYLSYLFNGKVLTSAKLASLSYLSSYFALGISLPLILGLTVIQGLYSPLLDSTFFTSFSIWISIIVIFNGAGTFGLVVSRMRSGHARSVKSIGDGLKHLPAIIVFFSAIPYHVAQSLLAYFVGFNMTWSATSKEFEQTTFSTFEEGHSFFCCALTLS
jgi:hypothetical protein